MTTVLDILANEVVPPKLLNDEGVPSASIGILDESGNISTRVITNGNENAETVYQACSISKAITGLAVAKLADDGRISYETKLVDYVPESILSKIVEPQTKLLEHVTVGMLLQHMSGLSQGHFYGYTGEQPTYEQMFGGEHPSNTPRIRLLTFPGAARSYCGAGTILVQIILERKFGEGFAQIMQDTVLGPLSMTRSSYADLPPQETNYARAHWTAHTQGTDAPLGYWRFMELAAAGLWTTPTDLLKAISAVQTSLAGGGGFLSQETAHKMLTATPLSHPSIDTAMGFSVNDHFFGHSGYNDPGYTTYVIGTLNATSSSTDAFGRGGIAILTNSSVGGKSVQRILAAIFCLKGWPLANLVSGMPSMAQCVPYAAPEGVNTDESWRSWTGTWGDGWLVSEAGGRPQVSFNSSPPLRLVPAAVPSKTLDGITEATYLVDGLLVAMRFLERDGEKVIELVQDLMGPQVRTLERK